jgi:hypothetical protein
MSANDERRASILAGEKALEGLKEYIKSQIRCLDLGAIQDIYRTMGLIRGDIISNEWMIDKYGDQG